jgi:ubiquinone/menaquinone biosynthesis C-methylase UbiE
MVTNTTRDIERFNRWSHTYERSYLQGLIFDRAHRAVLELIADYGKGAAPESILDVGCGTGRFLRKAEQRWSDARLIGVDPAEGMIEMARHLTPGATFYVSMAESLPLPDASVDVAVTTLSFHHWSDQAAGVREVARVLRPGGHFFLVDAFAPAWMWIFVRLLNPYNPHISKPRNPTQMQALFTQAGLHVQFQRPVAWRNVFVTVGMRPV